MKSSFLTHDSRAIYPNKKTVLRLIPVVLIAFTLTACTTQRAWVYPDQSIHNKNKATNSKYKTQTVSVTPFLDQRENANRDNLSLSIVPGVPYVKANYQVPETSNAHVNSKLWINFKPTEDFSKALATELSNTDLFAASYFSHEKKADYHLVGEIINTQYKGRIYTYGASIYAPLLWSIGLPYGEVSNDLAIKLSLVNTKTGKSEFSKSYLAPTYEKRSWIYNVHSDFEYSAMLKSIYEEFIVDLRASANSKKVSVQSNDS